MKKIDRRQWALISREKLLAEWLRLGGLRGKQG